MTTEWHHLRHSGVFIVKSEQISHIVLFVLLTLNKEMSAGNIFKVVIDLLFFAFLLTFSWRRPLSYRNQSIDLRSEPW